MKRVVLISACLVLALTMSFGLAGCGKKANGNMVIGVSNFLDTLNPMAAEMESSAEIINLIYDPLTRYDEGHEAQPNLAESWELSDDQLTWTFKLVDTKWHDGEPFTSKDVKWTYDTMLGDDALGYMYRELLVGITDIECPDDRTVVIKTDEPKANMLEHMTPILPEHIWSEVAKDEMATWKNDEPVGTGPFCFAEKKEKSVTLTKNVDYFGGESNIGTLTFVEYKSSDSMAQALKTGEIDGTTSVSADQKKTLQEVSNLEVVSGETPGFTQIGVNVYAEGKGNPLLKDKAIRHAIEYATDKEKAIKMFYDNAGDVGTTMLNPVDKYHYEPTKDELRSFDLDKANEILDKAGYSKKGKDGIRESADGKKLQFKLINKADNTDEIKFAQVIKSGCKEVGIDIKLVTMDAGALCDAVEAYDYDMFIWGWGGEVDPTSMLSLLTTDEIASCNEPGWTNEEYDKMFKKQSTIMDEKERIALVQDMQKMVYEDAPYIILVYDNYTQVFNKDKWDNIKQIPDDGLFFFNLTILNYMNATPK